jgi:predicted ATPase/DNA-binding XRE family transcriptional regulator
MSAVGSLLRMHRDAAALTQEELAERAGVSARTVSDIERGLRSRLYSDTAARLAAALGLADRDLDSFMVVARGREAPQPHASSVPRPITELVGRDAELASVVDALNTGRRLMTVTGLGGVGKTRLALACAERLEETFAGRLHFLVMPVDAAIDRFVGLVAGTIGSADRPDALASHLQGRPTLLILDSFEHSLAARSPLQELLVSVPELQVLVTSREPLQIAGELQIALAPLAVADSGDAAWREAGACRLFLDRARDVTGDVDADPDAVVEICRRLSGLPLAIELAAARLRHLPLSTLRDRLRADLTELLVQPSGSDTTNPVEETLRWTIESLSPEAARALRACALLPGGWQLAAIEAALPDGSALSAVSALVDKGLAYLEHSKPGSPARWQMLDMIRGYVLAHTPDDADAGWRAAYRTFYGELLATARANLGREREWYEVIAAEDANLMTALRWAADAGDARGVLDLANGMWFYWQSRGALNEGRYWLELGLHMEPPADEQLRMTALWGNAMLAHHQGEDDVAEACAKQLHALATRRGDDTALRHAATMLGMVAISRQDAADAVVEMRRALELAAGLDDEWIHATSWLNLGLGLLSDGAVDAARAAFGEALRRYEQLDDERFHARCVGYLGMASLVEGDPERARALFLDSLRVFHRLGEPGGTAEALTGIAAADAAIGDASGAARLAAAAERLRQRVAARQLPLDRRTTDHYLAAARDELGEQTWAELWRDGHESSLEQAVERVFATASSDVPA